MEASSETAHVPEEGGWYIAYRGWTIVDLLAKLPLVGGRLRPLRRTRIPGATPPILSWRVVIKRPALPPDG